MIKIAVNQFPLQYLPHIPTPSHTLTIHFIRNLLSLDCCINCGGHVERKSSKQWVCRRLKGLKTTRTQDLRADIIWVVDLSQHSNHMVVVWQCVLSGFLHTSVSLLWEWYTTQKNPAKSSTVVRNWPLIKGWRMANTNCAPAVSTCLRCGAAKHWFLMKQPVRAY